jgi:DNA-binding transcriptional LysR family regulator
MRLRAIAAAHPRHPLHRIRQPLTNRDLRAHRHLVVRETGSQRTTRALSVEAVQRWTVSHLATSIQAARMGYGFAWYPEDAIRDELAQGTLKPLQLREGAVRFAELYLIIAERDDQGRVRCASRRLSEAIQSECPNETTTAA